jgi:hypothetical protein
MGSGTAPSDKSIEQEDGAMIEKKMKVKNVIKGLLQEYKLEEITIIQLSANKVLYSGTVDGWKATEVDMILYKREVENMEVDNRIMFNHKKAFLFV